nr:MAG TPA: UBA-like domain protein [Bacteriophage sp.]
MRGQFFVTLIARNGGACMVEKLVSLGFTQQMAEDIIWAYQDDLPGLKAYVQVIEIVAAHV